MHMDNQEKPSTLRCWWVACRVFAIPASAVPVIFGTVLAVSMAGAELDWLRFVLALLGMAVLHTAANLLNDAADFKKGLDKRVNPVSGAVVRGWIEPRQALMAGWFLLASGILIGLYLVWLVGWSLLFIGAAGILLGVLYSLGPWPLKHYALGDLAVFSSCGLLGSLGAWTCQTGQVSWLPVLWSVPIGLLIAAILHANNWRDIPSDVEGGIHTLANSLGDRASVVYFAFLLFFPFVFVAAWVALSWLDGLEPRMPWLALLSLLALPLAVSLMRRGMLRRAPAKPMDFLALDGAVAQLSLIFGLLYIAGIGLQPLVG